MQFYFLEINSRQSFKFSFTRNVVSVFITIVKNCMSVDLKDVGKNLIIYNIFRYHVYVHFMNISSKISIKRSFSVK